LIRPLLKDADMMVRAQAAMALWRLDADVDRVVPVLIDALESNNPVASSAATSALGEIGPPAKAALPHLFDHANRVSAPWRKYVHEAIEHIDRDALRKQGGS
jgi:HEAT repeat protein